MYNEDMDGFENYEMMLRMEFRENEWCERMANIRRELYDLPNKKEAEMADYLQLDQLEEGNFYYVLEHNDEPENRFVWYKRDGRLKNPRCCSDTLNTTEQYHCRPITLDKADEFDEWMEKHGDCIGKIAWIAYQMKLREAKMAKKNDAEKEKKLICTILNSYTLNGMRV